MPIYALNGVSPRFEDRDSCFIAPDAVLVGNITIGRDVSIWFGAVIRGDGEQIVIGAGSNVQEHTVMHTDPGFPLTVGPKCTVGHRALLHGCTVGEGSLVGMGAILLNGSVIGRSSLVGAGALVTERKVFDERSLIVGSPARAVRSLDDAALAGLERSARHYVENGRRFRAGLSPV